MTDPDWHDLGAVEELRRRSLVQLQLGRAKLALSCVDGEFGAISGVCNHAGGPLGEGRLDGDYVVCPWHHWKFHRRTGEGEPGFEADRVPSYDLRQEGVITGGQDNVQAVAGQMLMFFGELGCVFPQFPFIAHSRGWTAEDMERNVAFVQESGELHQGARELVDRAVEMARAALGAEVSHGRIVRAGRKASGGARV